MRFRQSKHGAIRFGVRYYRPVVCYLSRSTTGPSTLAISDCAFLFDAEKAIGNEVIGWISIKTVAACWAKALKKREKRDKRQRNVVPSCYVALIQSASVCFPFFA